MKVQKITLGLAALAAGGLQVAQAENMAPLADNGLSAAALKQLEIKKQQLKKPIKPGSAGQVFAEMGDPWIEWQQESARQFRNRTINPAEITARFNQFKR
ncbi:MAG: hypothetical protein R3F02_18960 [Thiolinea sp.]